MAFKIIDDGDEIARRTLRDLHRLGPVQRDIVIETILRADPELEPVLPQMLGLYGGVKRARRQPLRRDSVE